MYNTYLCDQNQQSIFSVFCTDLKKNWAGIAGDTVDSSELNQISLTRPAVLILTAVWRHISEGRATGVDWQPCVAIVSALSGYAVRHFLCARAAIT